MPPKYVFNHIVLYDEVNQLWCVYHKLDKRIPKTVEHYGPSPLYVDDSVSKCLKNSLKHGVKPWDLQVILPKNSDIDLPENWGSIMSKNWGSD